MRRLPIDRAKSRTDGICHRTEDYHYDALDRLTSFTVSDAKSVASTFAYGYGYDDFGNMISEQQGGKPKATFGFGQNGAGPHELTSGPAGAYTYDTRGRVKTEPDAAFTFTELDLPKTITPIVGNSTGKPLAPTELQYDAEHTRVFQSGPAGYTLHIAGLYERREPAGKRPDPDKAVHVFYVVGPEGVVAQITASPHGPLPTFGEVAYVHHDRLGSTSVVTDAKGKAQLALYYQPFGARSNFEGEAVGPPKTDVLLGFDGLRHDDNLGLIDQRGRVYEPATHRFLTPDPLVGQPLDSQSWNPYAFVRNSPVNRVDPSGFTEGGGGGLTDGSVFTTGFQPSSK